MVKRLGARLPGRVSGVAWVTPWLAVLTACAGLPAGSSGPPSVAASAGPAASAPAVGPAPSALPVFAAVIKDAHKIEGLLTLWQKDERVWIELRPQDLGQPMFLSPKIASGIGEAGLYGGTMIGQGQPWGRAQVVEFRRIHNQVQLVARNTQFTAAEGSPQARAVRSGFSDSLLGATAVASLPHPDSKSVLVDANALFLPDLLGLGITLQRQYRQNYALDTRNSAITDVRGSADESVLNVLAHFATAALNFPLPGATGAPMPSLPAGLPDARSLFLGLHYSIARLPPQPMARRLADPRIGHFTTVVQDFSDDLQRSPKQRYIDRWRLDKQDPAAELSPPAKPITFWLDRSIPLKYRDSITRGVLEWNKAFEKIGLHDALVVKLAPDDSSFSTQDVASAASIRWMTNVQPAFVATGPSQVDPRTGEILSANIGIDSLAFRSMRAARSRIFAPASAMSDWAALMQAPELAPGAAIRAQDRTADEVRCQVGDVAAEQLGYALNVMGARGDIEPDSAEAESFVQDYLYSVTLHEVGHTLGLRHNFRASRVYTEAQLSDPRFTREHGIAGSVMDYTPVNLPAPRETGGAPFPTTLGPYDFWAIEYAYKPMAPGTSPADEAATLQQIAARSAEPALAYGTDEDNSLGLDPETLMFDLGADPVAFAAKRLAIARDIIHRQESRELKPTEDYAALRRSISYALRDAARAAGILARQIGGLRTLRDFPGTGRDPLLPVPVGTQRQALSTLEHDILAADGLTLSPQLARKLGVDFQERAEGEDFFATDFAMESVVLDLQIAVLNVLMSDGMAARLLDAQGKAERIHDTMPLSEVQRGVTRAVWGDLNHEDDIPAARRELQREHLNRIVSQLLRPSPASRADARSLLRADARQMLKRLQAANRRSGWSPVVRSHLQDSVDTLRTALTAPLQRGGI